MVVWMTSMMIFVLTTPSPDTGVMIEHPVIQDQIFYPALPRKKGKRPKEAAERSDDDSQIQTGHCLITDPQTGRVKGVRIHARLKDRKTSSGTWHFIYPIYQRVKGIDGTHRLERRHRRIPSHDGEVFLSMKNPGKRRIIITWKDESTGKEKAESRRYDLVIPGIQMKADRKDEHGPTTIRARVGGKKVKGDWFLAVARMNGKILQFHQGEPRFTLALIKGKYLVRTVFNGKVDGSPVAIHETKRLWVREGKSGTYRINQAYDNRFVTPAEATEAVKGMVESGRLSDPEHKYAARRVVYYWAVAWLSVLLVAGLLYLRVRKRKSRH
ncbi:hypothetical protein [Salinithrix halophila]|uniref:DUF1583 domain-containing protein n=1 Tax=Salinithrix halophila TaxID=1485204 RepID=A0ABV8JE19_9BACL